MGSRLQHARLRVVALAAVVAAGGERPQAAVHQRGGGHHLLQAGGLGGGVVAEAREAAQHARFVALREAGAAVDGLAVARDGANGAGREQRLRAGGAAEAVRTGALLVCCGPEQAARRQGQKLPRAAKKMRCAACYVDVSLF